MAYINDIRWKAGRWNLSNRADTEVSIKEQIIAGRTPEQKNEPRLKVNCENRDGISQIIADTKRK